MDRQKTHLQKILGIWLLIAVFVLPFVVQSLHIHHEETLSVSLENTTDEEHHTHDCHTCLLCGFTLSNFLSIEKADIPLYTSTPFFQLPFYQEKGYSFTTHTFNLRAPPGV